MEDEQRSQENLHTKAILFVAEKYGLSVLEIIGHANLFSEEVQEKEVEFRSAEEARNSPHAQNFDLEKI